MSTATALIGQSGTSPIAAVGNSLVVHEWSGSGPPYMHVHHEDDEAWHVLEGTLRFRLSDREIDAGPGATVFVPAGTPHTYWEIEPSRYLIILTPKLDRLIGELATLADPADLAATLARYDSALVQ